MRCLIELLIVIDAERSTACLRSGASPGRLRRKEARSHRRRHKVRAEVVELGYIGVECVTGNLGVMPVDRKRDRRIAQYAEVERVVGVLPYVLAAEHHELAKRLLEARMKFVAEAGGQRT